LTGADNLPAGIMANRRKGSLDGVTKWTPRLRAAWDAAMAARTTILARKANNYRPVPLRAAERARSP
jgi:hypothetical protein